MLNRLDHINKQTEPISFFSGLACSCASCAAPAPLIDQFVLICYVGWLLQRAATLRSPGARLGRGQKRQPGSIRPATGRVQGRCRGGTGVRDAFVSLQGLGWSTKAISHWSISNMLLYIDAVGWLQPMTTGSNTRSGVTIALLLAPGDATCCTRH